jgi:hypothetical protein
MAEILASIVLYNTAPVHEARNNYLGLGGKTTDDLREPRCYLARGSRRASEEMRYGVEDRRMRKLTTEVAPDLTRCDPPFPCAATTGRFTNISTVGTTLVTAGHVKSSGIRSRCDRLSTDTGGELQGHVDN